MEDTKILLVEDEKKIADSLHKGLTENNFSVQLAYDGLQGKEMFEQNDFDLVILDINLPLLNGYELCKKIRNRKPNIPVVMLTALSAIEDKIEGFDAGADDYMIKPFNLDELLARVRALLRRTQPERVPVLKFADLTLDTGSRQASRGNRQISLTAKEYELLELFLRHPKQVLTREVIFDRVWGYDFGGESNVLEVYIRYLRQKLEGEEEPRLIHTVRGVGYVLRENP